VPVSTSYRCRTSHEECIHAGQPLIHPLRTNRVSFPPQSGQPAPPPSSRFVLRYSAPRPRGQADGIWAALRGEILTNLLEKPSGSAKMSGPPEGLRPSGGPNHNHPLTRKGHVMATRHYTTPIAAAGYLRAAAYIRPAESEKPAGAGPPPDSDRWLNSRKKALWTLVQVYQRVYKQPCK
jgi:hypothetical protein